MLCSQCQEIVSPVVAVDIDGTLGDYHGHFLRFAEQWLGRGLLDNYQGKPSFSDWMLDTNDVDKPTYRAIKLAYRQGGQKRSMPVIPGARALTEEIIGAGAELWVTTTRPYLSTDTIVPDTVEWLRRNEIRYTGGMLFDEDKYQQLATRVDPRRVVAVIDDLPDLCDDADEAIGRQVAILAANDYNGVYAGRRSQLVDIYHNIGPMIAEWREEWANIAA